jgi:hypothetical protein
VVEPSRQLARCSTKNGAKGGAQCGVQRKRHRLGWHGRDAGEVLLRLAWSKPAGGGHGMRSRVVHLVTWSPRTEARWLVRDDGGARFRTRGCHGGVRWCAGLTTPTGHLLWSRGKKKKKRGVRERCVHPVGFQAKYVREGEGSGLTRRKQGRVVGCAGGQGACCSFAWREVREREVASHPWQYLLRFSISFFPTGSSQPGHCSRS